MKRLLILTISLVLKANLSISQVYSLAEFVMKYGEMKTYNSTYLKSADRNDSQILEQSRLERSFEIYTFQHQVDLKKLYGSSALGINLYTNGKNEPHIITFRLRSFSYDSTQKKFTEITHELSSDNEQILKKALTAWMANLEIRHKSLSPQLFQLRYSAFQNSSNTIPKTCNNQTQVCTLEDAKFANPDSVKVVNFSSLDLKEFPEIILNFKNVEQLVLNNNFMAQIPAQVWKLKKLKSIDISNNFIDNEHLHIAKSKSIKTVNLQFNVISQIPNSIKKLKALEVLLLGNNDLNGLESQKIKGHKGLKDLNIYQSYISELPLRLYRFKELQVFDVYHNNLKSLPADFDKNTSLKTLAISYNDFWKLPELSNLQKLENFYAHHNKLDRIDGSLPPSVVLFDIGYNQMESIPKKVFDLQNLQILDISNNHIKDVPHSILDILKLKEVYYLNNPFCIDPEQQEQFENFEKKIKPILGN